jgi:hypothetical protein
MVLTGAARVPQREHSRTGNVVRQSETQALAANVRAAADGVVTLLIQEDVWSIA